MPAVRRLVGVFQIDLFDLLSAVQTICRAAAQPEDQRADRFFCYAGLRRFEAGYCDESVPAILVNPLSSLHAD